MLLLERVVMVAELAQKGRVCGMIAVLSVSVESQGQCSVGVEIMW